MKTEINRRDFLRNSAVGAAAVVWGTSAGMSQSRTRDQQDQSHATIIRRPLGKTGIVLPVVSMGVMRSDNPELVRGALKAGMVHLDTAHGYQGGRNETMLGKVLKDYSRDSFVIATKIPPDARDAFMANLDISLERLQMSYVDILYLHGISSGSDAQSEEMTGLLKAAKASGKVRHVGLSTHKNEPEVINAAVDAGTYEVILTSFNFKQDHSEEIRKAIARAASAGVGIVGMKSMAGAFYDKERTKPINCRAALKWVLQDPNVTTTIPGITTFEHLAENASVNQDLTLTQQEKDDLAGGKAQGSLYCQGCEECKPGCSRNVPIPELMRAYMYTYGYGNAPMAHELLRGTGIAANPCVGCPECTAVCRQGFPVRERITDIARLAAVPPEFLS